MDAEIIGFERRPIQDRVKNEKGELEVQTFEVGVLTLRCAVPESLPVGCIVELKVKPKEEEKPE